MVFGAIVGTTAALGLLVSIFGDRYESSPEEVQDACDELINIQQNTLSAIADEIGQNVVIVNNASNGYVDMSNMNAYVPAVEESIANLTGMLDKQAQIIEEYNSGSLVEKMIGTGTMAILNVTEGVLKFGEDILDCGANILAGVGTFCGFDTEEIELWAAKDHVGDAFNDAFENGAFSWVEKYSIYSHESAAAELLKGIGTAVPYIALAATGVGLVAEAGIAGAAGFGRGSTNYQQQHLVYDATGKAAFDDTYSTGSMMWEGTKQGAIDAVLTVGMDKGLKALGKGISKLKAGKVAQNADEVTKALTTSDDAARALTNSTDNVINTTTNTSKKTIHELNRELDNIKTAVKNKEMTQAEADAARKIIRKQIKEVHPDMLAGQAARNAKAASETVEQTVGTVASETAEQTVKKTATGTTELTVRNATSDTTVKNIKNATSDAKSKIKEAFEGMESPGNTTTTGPRLGDNTMSAKVTRAYDNAAAGLKNVGQKAGTAAKKVVTDTATFIKENPKSALIGGGLIAAEKTIGNMKTSYIPTDYASGEIKNFATTGNGETRIVIDDVDDITIPSTSPEQFASTDSTGSTGSNGTTGSTGSTGSNGSGYSGGTYTPSSPDLKPTTPGQNSDTSTTEKTPEKTTDNEKNNNPSKNPDDANKPTTDDNKTPDDNKTTNPTPTPSKDESSVVSNPPSSNNNQSTSGVNHGGTTTNNNSGNNNWNSNPKTDSNNETTSELEPELEPELPIEDSDLIEEPNEEESVYTIPSNLSGVSETKKSSSGSGVLPVLGGLGAAAAVGVGAKMYLDNKKNNENGEDEDSDGEFDEYSNDEFTDSAENNDLLADEWNGEDTEFNYENPSGSSIVEPDDDDLGEM